MRTADHMNLSRYIMDHMDAGASKLKKAAFIFGSIEPDINMLTYFRGSIHGEEKLRGHNYENVQKYMEKLTNKLTKKLEKGGMGTIRQSFLLGKLVHYVADSFTYPHNSIFPGNLREHCQYETELHDYVNKTISSVGVNMESIDDGRDIVEYLREMHTGMSVRLWDARMITDISHMQYPWLQSGSGRQRVCQCHPCGML